jgi:hypothetical protein
VILRLERAVECTNRTDIAIGIQQRVANRTRSSVCHFHSPWPDFLPAPSSVNRAPYNGFTSNLARCKLKGNGRIIKAKIQHDICAKSAWQCLAPSS